MSRPIIIALSCGALACGGAFVAGCGGDDNKDSATTLPVGSTPATTGAPAKAGAVTVVMQNNLFSPEKITVKVGQQIHWTNNDSYPHNVTATTKDAGLQSKNINGGGTFDFTAKKPGTINYICTIHSGQKGSIRITR
jgi:plastocyanin